MKKTIYLLIAMLTTFQVSYAQERVLKGIPPLFHFIRKQRPDIVMGSIGHVNIAMGIFSIFFPLLANSGFGYGFQH